MLPMFFVQLVMVVMVTMVPRYPRPMPHHDASIDVDERVEAFTPRLMSKTKTAIPRRSARLPATNALGDHIFGVIFGRVYSAFLFADV